MKIIQCDICKRILGKEVDTGTFLSITGSDYNPRDFRDSGFFVDPTSGKSLSDVCTECSNKVVEAQNDAIKKIRESVEPK